MMIILILKKNVLHAHQIKMKRYQINKNKLKMKELKRTNQKESLNKRLIINICLK